MQQVCHSSDEKHQVENSRCNTLFISLQQTNVIQVAVIYLLCRFATLVSPKDAFRRKGKDSYSLFHAIALEKMIVELGSVG